MFESMLGLGLFGMLLVAASDPDRPFRQNPWRREAGVDPADLFLLLVPVDPVRPAGTDQPEGDLKCALHR